MPQDPDSTTTARRRVGLALSGGAARGFAHIGVIAILEQAGITVDVVAGTSMGSIVGGLYAIGYSSERLLELATNTDWLQLFDDAPLRRNLPLSQKREQGRYLITLPIKDGMPRAPSGFIPGQRISQFLALLSWRAHPITDFRDLPIPYAAIATDAETGDAVRLTGGVLADAIRASMAIPSVFEPVEIDGRLLIDGGMARNLPAEDARALGADLLICSDVSKPLMPADSLSDLLAVLDQTVSYRIWESTLAQRQICDVLILPDITGPSSASFDEAAEWVRRGEQAARDALQDLRALSLAGEFPRQDAEEQGERRSRRSSSFAAQPATDSVYVSALQYEGLRTLSPAYLRERLGIDAPGWVRLSEIDRGVARLFDTGRFRTVTYRLEAVPEAGSGPVQTVPTGTGTQVPPPDPHVERVLVVALTEQSYGKLGLGYRYESRYKASILGSAVFVDPLARGSRGTIDLRLGEQGALSGRLEQPFGHRPELLLALDAGFRRVPFDIYEGDLRRSTPRAHVTHVGLTASLGTGHAAALGLRAKAEHANLGEFSAAGAPFKGANVTFYTLSACLDLDTYDRASFPRSGGSLFLKGEWADRAIGSGLTFRHYVADLAGAAPISRRFSLLGRVVLGTSSGGDLPDHYLFFLGGANRYYMLPDRHFQFSGLRTLERYGRHVQSLQIGLQYEFWQYLTGRFRWNAGRVLDEWDTEFDRLTYGFDLTLAAVTRFGNAALSVSALDFNSLPSVDVDVGFPF